MSCSQHGVAGIRIDREAVGNDDLLEQTDHEDADAHGKIRRDVPSSRRADLLAEVDARKSANAIIIAEQGRWYTAVIRPLLALPVIIYLWKVIVWDKVLGWGTTDAIAGDVGVWAGTIVTTYVGGRSLEKIARTIWSRP